MRLPSGKVLAKEIDVRESSGVDDSNLASMLKYASGARRPLRVKVADPTALFSSDEHGAYIEIQCALPAGSYATVVLAHCLGKPSWFKEISQ